MLFRCTALCIIYMQLLQLDSVVHCTRFLACPFLVVCSLSLSFVVCCSIVFFTARCVSFALLSFCYSQIPPYILYGWFFSCVSNIAKIANLQYCFNVRYFVLWQFVRMNLTEFISFTPQKFRTDKFELVILFRLCCFMRANLRSRCNQNLV